MSIWIGKPEYSPVRGYGELNCDMSKIVSTITITEGRVIEITDGYAIAMIADSITDLSKPDSFKSGTPCCLIIHTKQYTRFVSQQNPRVPTDPTALELLMDEFFKTEGAKWIGKNFKGKLSINGTTFFAEALRDSRKWHILFDAEEIEPSQITNLEAASGSGSGGNRAKAQSEKERLEERHQYLISAAGEYGKGCNTLAELAIALTQMQNDSPANYNIFLDLARIILA